MNKSFIIIILSLTQISCHSQPKQSELLGGPCKGCEALLEYGNKVLSSGTTLPLYDETEPKIELTGTVYQSDGSTPAPDVIIYIYHTDRKGLYENFNNESGWGRRHGSLRGWVQTQSDGKYTFHTFRPAAYPKGREPEHIHMTVKELNKKEYYIDDILFDDDPLLTTNERSQLKKRVGSGVVKPVLKDGIWHVKRDIILGKNIPYYH